LALALFARNGAKAYGFGVSGGNADEDSYAGLAETEARQYENASRGASEGSQKVGPSDQAQEVLEKPKPNCW
jgi:hypothetical protein